MKRSYIIFLFVVFTILSFEIIYFSRVIKSSNRVGSLNITDNDKSQGAVNKMETKAVSNSDIKVSPSARIEMIQYYDKCGHTISEEHKVPSAVVNMNEEDIRKYYRGWDIEFFSKDYIKLFKKNNGICPHHYELRDIDGYISIFNKDVKGNEVLYKATDIVTKYLSEKDRLNLEKGVSVEGKEKLEELLQDFE